jgi:hypothetical protein
MSEREPLEGDERAPEAGPNWVRAIKIAAILFGLLAAAVAIAALLTDGSPHVPFDYGEGIQ